jgi:hypothetical protein
MALPARDSVGILCKKEKRLSQKYSKNVSLSLSKAI